MALSGWHPHQAQKTGNPGVLRYQGDQERAPLVRDLDGRQRGGWEGRVGGPHLGRAQRGECDALQQGHVRRIGHVGRHRGGAQQGMRSLGHRLQELRWGLRQVQALANGEHLLDLFAAPPCQRSILFGSPEVLLGLPKGRRGDRQSA